MRTKKLNDVFTPDNGIFANLENYDVPWKDLDIALLLDSEYHFNVAGMRSISPLLYNLLDDAETLTAEQRSYIASIVSSMFSLRWSKLWETMNFEYNPIENYDMTEEMTNDETVTEYGKTDTLTHDTTEETEIEKNTTDERTADLTTTNEREVQGFNSSAYVPSEKTTETESGTDTTTHTGTDTDTRTKTGTETNVQSGSDTNTRNYTLTRHGNIGVTTSQQMIESERNLWNWEFFYDVVFPDVNRILTLCVY